MPRENVYNAIILKKSPYNEGDEILTMFTRENGKVRALAKSTKFPKSKLQHALQACFFVKITTAGRGLSKLIGAEIQNAFPNIRESLEAAKQTFYCLEVTLKATPDEQKNEALFDLLINYFTFLDLRKTHGELASAGFAKFKIEFLESLGLAIHIPARIDPANGYLGFSPSRGSFISGEDTADLISIKPKTLEQFIALRGITFASLISKQDLPEAIKEDMSELHSILSAFIQFQLERDIKSEKYL